MIFRSVKYSLPSLVPTLGGRDLPGDDFQVSKYSLPSIVPTHGGRDLPEDDPLHFREDFLQ
jgi:hypothetical protein